MSQQALDLRRSMQIVRQHTVVMAILVVLGLLGGAAYAFLEPPMLTSIALIALPESSVVQATLNGGGGTTAGTDPFTATQEVVAGSYPVLLGALHNARPAMTLFELRRYVKIGSPSPGIVSVSAKGKDAASAEATANALAESYIRYVGSSQSAVGHVQARLLASANNATGPSRPERTILYALLGAVAGFLIGFVVALAIGRNDRRLRQRDEIANSIGIPVLASVPVVHPSGAAGWTKLFADYKPTARQSWQLSTVLQQLGVGALSIDGRAVYGDGRSFYNGRSSAYDAGSFSVAVLSFSADTGALALGPQLAVFAASQGIPTTLVCGPEQDGAASASLRIACTAPPQGSKRSELLRIAASDEGDLGLRLDTALVVLVVVVDSRAPEMPNTLRTSATVLGVSAGAATAEQLARAALAASADGREITGIIVADPLETDQTTGRVPRLARPAGPRLPNRLRGIVTEIRR